MVGIIQLCRAASIVYLFTLLTACATSSLFNPYPSQALVYQDAIYQGNVGVVDKKGVLLALSEKKNDADSMLYMMERGRINQLDDNFKASLLDFEWVIDKFEKQDLDATIQLSSLANQSAALISNDNAIPYQGAGYERILTHHHQAFNYLGQQDKEGASVEFRKVALEQSILLEQHEKEIDNAYDEAEENSLDLENLSNEFSGMDTVAGKVKSSFQNAYTFYTSAAFWEATGDYNAAWIDYKKAYEINSNNGYLKQDVARMAKKLGVSTYLKDLNEAKPGQGSVVVFFEEGFVPAKEEIRIPIPTFDGGFISLAFPYYKTEFWPKSQRLRAMTADFNDLGYSQEVADISALAVKDLKEQVPKLLVRQALRGIAKYKMQQNATEQAGLAGQFLANVYNMISETADRRSWLTLPHTAQVMRFNLDEGSQEILLSTPNSKASVLLDVRGNRTLFIRAVAVKNQLMTQIYTL